MTEQTLTSRLTAIRSSLSFENDLIRNDHDVGAGGDVIVQRRTALIDRTLREIYHLHVPAGDQPSLVAIGGYGRGELNPHSDIDIMLLCGDERQRERSSPLLYSFWDAGLDIGYSVRTVNECIGLARDDTKIRTSLLESRLIVGDGALYRSFKERIHAEVFNRKIDGFIAEKVSERAAARLKFGGSLYLREPNIKESTGGLRDLHLARWIAMTRFRVSSFEDLVPRGVISTAELGSYYRCRNFLWRVRNEVQFRSGRKNDQLTYDLQESAARNFRYRDSADLLAVERFMKTYFIHARAAQDFSRMVTERSLPTRKRRWFDRPRVLGNFTVLGRTLLPSAAQKREIVPADAMEAFAAVRERGLTLSEGLRQQVRSCRLSDADRASDGLARPFLAILDRLEGLAETLTEMRDLRLLGRYLPEFRIIQGLARHDYFHLFTVDEHILTAIRNLEDLWLGRHQAGGALADAIRGIEKRWVLTLAVLLHDLGKAFREDHDRRGTEIAARILDRMGISGEERERILFLVEHHLVMSTLSQRRELGDRYVIAEFARTVGDQVNLTLLYLLTYADMSAVGPAVWTPWKATLLQELYARTRDHFIRPEGPADEEARLSAIAERLRGDAKGRFETPLVDEFLSRMPRHYLLTTTPERLMEHLDWIERLPEERLVVRYRHLPERGCTELSICAYDAYGMFYRTAGTIAAQGLNIVRAKVYTGRSGIMIDTFEVTGADGSMVEHDEVWTTVVQDLRRVLVAGGRPPEGRISAYVRARPGQVTPSVSFDNASSDVLTIIDLVAKDRVGLLYRVTKALYDLNLDIASAKIATEGIRAIDSFYVADMLGAKITDPERISKVRSAVLRALEPEMGSST